MPLELGRRALLKIMKNNEKTIEKQNQIWLWERWPELLACPEDELEVTNTGQDEEAPVSPLTNLFLLTRLQEAEELLAA